MTALADRVATPVDRADFDDLVTLVTQAPPWDKDRAAGARILLRAIGDGKASAPDQILGRWTWRLARSVRKTLDRKASQEFPEAKRLLGAVANSRGHRHEENVGQLVRIAAALPLPVGAALLASAEGYTPRANGVLDRVREGSARSRRSQPHWQRASPRRRRPYKSRRRRRRRSPSSRRRRRSRSPRATAPPPRAWPPRSRRRWSRSSRATPSPPAGRTAPPGAGLALVLGRLVASFAVAQEPRQLGGERLAARQLAALGERLDRVGAMLELLDVRLRVRVGGDCLAHLVRVLALSHVEVARVDLDPEEDRRAVGRAPWPRAGSARARRSAARRTAG